ncbi:MAG TPA: hypothetical protein VJX91_01015, partial [Candidatus Eisenbacteria bacterium]|nr:hypothetical protein [Candidatus Eisenbacteria bacterium]
MPRALLGFAILALMALALLLPGLALALPAGYFVDSTEAFEPRPARLDYDDGDFTLAIRRQYANMTEE